MFVELYAKQDLAPLGAKPSFRTYGAGGLRRSKFYKHLAPTGAKAAHDILLHIPVQKVGNQRVELEPIF